jgi:translation initiation factor eIF-2B subunit delta
LKAEHIQTRQDQDPKMSEPSVMEQVKLPPSSTPEIPATETAEVTEAGPVTATATEPSAQANGNAKGKEPAGDDAAKKISPAELKKQKAAEKQARRAQQKASGPATAQAGPSKEGPKQPKGPKQAPKEEKSKPLPVRRRPSQSNMPQPQQPKKEAKAGLSGPKQLGLFFGHLYSQPRRYSMAGASKDVHPAVLALGLQYSSYTICGSTARMVAMLLAFKALIESYQTPVGTSLSRHLIQLLGPQIEYLRDCRPYSISMGNAIRWLKDSRSLTYHAQK